MSNVTKFPTQEVKASSLLQRLTDIVDSLEVQYSCLDTLHADLHTAEISASETEAELDILLHQYVPLVGVENVDPILLTYSTNVKVIENEDGFELMWMGDADE